MSTLPLPFEPAQNSGTTSPFGSLATASEVRRLPMGSAVVIDNVNGQPIDHPFTARIVGVDGYLVCPPGITETFVRPQDGETYRVLWVKGQEDEA